MNSVLRILALLMVLAALILAGFAYMLARRPAPELAMPGPSVPAEPGPAPSSASTTPVVVAAHPLKTGTVLSASMLRVERWPQAPAESYPSDTGLINQVLRFDMQKGQPLTPFLLARGLANYLSKDQRALEIPVTPMEDWRAIRPGDHVDVYFTLSQDREVDDTQSRLAVARVRVLAYGGRSLDHPAPAANAGDRTRTPTHAIVAIPQEQVNLLRLLAAKGTLQLVLRSSQDPSAPDPSLFPGRERVLAGRADLDPEDRRRLADPANIAYAGESLGRVAANQNHRDKPRPVPEDAVPRDHPNKHTIQVIRGTRSTQQHY